MDFRKTVQRIRKLPRAGMLILTSAAKVSCQSWKPDHVTHLLVVVGGKVVSVAVGRHPQLGVRVEGEEYFHVQGLDGVADRLRLLL